MLQFGIVLILDLSGSRNDVGTVSWGYFAFLSYFAQTFNNYFNNSSY